MNPAIFCAHSAAAERAGHALSGGQPSAARLSAAKSLPVRTYLALGTLDSVTSGRGERSEPSTGAQFCAQALDGAGAFTRLGC